MHHLQALRYFLLKIFDGKSPGSITELAVDVGDDGDGEQVKGHLVDIITKELPPLFGILILIIIVRLITEIVLVILKGNNIRKILPSLQQLHQLLTHLDTVLPANHQNVNPAFFDLFRELGDLHSVRVYAVILADVDLFGGWGVDCQDQEEHLAFVVCLVRTKVAEGAGV